MSGAVAPAHRQISRTAGVLHIEPRRPGFVRLDLSAMASGTDVRIPISLRWTLGGTLHGLAAVAYSSDDPDHRTVIAPITIERPAD